MSICIFQLVSFYAGLCARPADIKSTNIVELAVQVKLTRRLRVACINKLARATLLYMTRKKKKTLVYIISHVFLLALITLEFLLVLVCMHDVSHPIFNQHAGKTTWT